MLFCIFGLFACSSSKPEAAAVKTPPPKQTSKGANALEVASDDDFGGGSEAAEPGKKKLASAKVPKPVLHLSVEGKKTGKMLDAVVIEQQNEFLGRNIIKITKAGARLESSMLTIIINPAHPPQAYNVQNGSTMALSAKSAALMAGSAPQTANLVTEHSKGKPDKVADIPCTYGYE